MKKFLIIATRVAGRDGRCADCSGCPAGAGVPPASPAPMAHPMRDKVMTRAEAVQMVREHFGEIDANKDGTITTAEIDAARTRKFEDFKGVDGGHAMAMGDPNAAFDRLDANKDGSISRDEFTKAREQRVERRIVRARGAQEQLPRRAGTFGAMSCARMARAASAAE